MFAEFLVVIVLIICLLVLLWPFLRPGMRLKLNMMKQKKQGCINCKHLECPEFAYADSYYWTCKCAKEKTWNKVRAGYDFTDKRCVNVIGTKDCKYESVIVDG